MGWNWKNILPILVIWISLQSFLVNGQRMPPPPPPINNQPPPPGSNLGKNPPPQRLLKNNAEQNGSMNMQLKNEELSNVKDENIKRVLLELSTLLTPSQMAETLARVAQLVGPLFFRNFDTRKEQIVVQGRNASGFPQRLLSSISDVQSEEVKALLLQKNLEALHAADFGFLPMAIHYALQESVLRNISGTKLASAVKVNRGDTSIAFKVTEALEGRKAQQEEFLQSLGTKILPDVQTIIIRQVLKWWGKPNQWKDRELSLLTISGDPLLAYLPPFSLEMLDDELADRFTSTLGQSNEIGKVWWLKPMSLKKAWFELAKGARYFGAVHEWSFRRMQKLSFLLEGASPEDLELIPPIPEIKGLVIQNHYTELQARVVFDAFYKKGPLSQEDLQEFQFHILDLLPTQLQRFDLADSFSTLDDMMSILETQKNPSYANLLQISYYMWPLLNTTNKLTIAPPNTWQKRDLSQIGKMLFLLPKSILFQLPPDLINWDSNTLQAIRSSHLSSFETWHLTTLIMSTIDERFKPDYVFLIPAPFQKGIPSHNISQVLLGSPLVRPEVLRALIEESSGMLTSQKAVIIQRIRHRLSESTIIRNILSSSDPSELFNLFSPRLILKNMAAIIKTILEMPEAGKFGITSIQTKLLPRHILSLWLNWVREQTQTTKWSAEDLVGRSVLGTTHAVNFAILGLSCRDVNLIDPLDILPVILHYRHEISALRNFKPNLSFCLNLRSCLLGKIVDYLKIKSNLNGNQTDGHILSLLTPGEIFGVGGEILSLIPVKTLETLPIETRIDIIEEIGSLDMLDLFRLVPLEELRWYGNALLRDIQIQRDSPPKIHSKRQASNETQTKDSTIEDSKFPDDEATVEDAIPAGNETPDPTKSSPDAPILSSRDIQQGFTVDSEAVQKLGNLFCYSEDVLAGNWSTQLLKDTLEAKTSPGEKTCCMMSALRSKWFALLQSSYGADTSSWNEFDLASIGDLLIVVPEPDLMKISRDALSKAISPILKQSGFDVKIMTPGRIDRQRFITQCTESLLTEGMDFSVSYKMLMNQLFKAAQWIVNTVKTTDELIKGSLGRTGRLPRWAEFKVVRKPRQVNLNYASGVLEYKPLPFTSPSTAFPTPTGTAPSPLNAFPASVGTSPLPMNSFPASTTFTNPQSPVAIPQTTQNYGQLGARNQGQFQNAQQGIQSPMQIQQGQFGTQIQGQFQQQPQLGSSNQGQFTPVPTNQLSSQVQGQFGAQGQLQQQVPSRPQGQLSSQNQAQLVTPIQGQIASTNQGQIVSPNQGQIASTNQGQIVSPNQGQIVSPNQGQIASLNQGQLGSQEQIQQNQFGNQNQGPFISQSQGQLGTQGQLQQGQFGNQGQIGAQNPGQSQSGQFGTQNQGPMQQGQLVNQRSILGSQNPAQYVPSNQGQVDLKNQGQFGTQGQGQQVQFSNQNQGQSRTMIQGQFDDQVQIGNQGSIKGQFGTQGQLQQNQFSTQGQLQQQGQFGNQAQLDIQTQGQFQQGRFGNQNPGQFQQGNLGNQNQGTSQQGQFGKNQGQVATPNQGQLLSSNQGQLGTQGQLQQSQLGNQGQFGNQNQGQFIPQNQGPLGSQNQGQFQQGLLGSQDQGQFQQGQFPGQQFNQQVGLGSPSDPTIDLTNRAIDVNTTSNDTSSSDAPLDEKIRSIDFNQTQPQAQPNGNQAEITCHGIKAAGPAAIGLSIEQLDELSEVELFDCIETLGGIEWDDLAKQQILNLITQKLFLTTEKLNVLTLIELGNLVTAIPVGSVTSQFGKATTENISNSLDLSKIDLTLPESLDTLAILGSKITDPGVLKVLAEKFNTDNRIFPGFSQGIARPENLRIAVLSLGNILCGFSDKIVNSIFESDASLFIDCSNKLGKLEGCPSEVLTTLATHAVRPSNYGHPRMWTQEDLQAIGVVFAGLKPDSISSIPPEAMQGLQPRAIKSLPTTSFIALTSQQISKMSFEAATSVQPLQSVINSLSPNQADALRKVVQVENEEFNIALPPAINEETHIDDTRSLHDLNPRAKNDTLDQSGRAGKETTTSTTEAPITTTASTEAPPTEHPESEIAPKSGSSTISPAFNSFIIVIGLIILNY